MSTRKEVPHRYPLGECRTGLWLDSTINLLKWLKKRLTGSRADGCTEQPELSNTLVGKKLQRSGKEFGSFLAVKT